MASRRLRAQSPIGAELLIGIAPDAGKMAVYALVDGPPRGNDGSCKSSSPPTSFLCLHTHPSLHSSSPVVVLCR